MSDEPLGETGAEIDPAHLVQSLIRVAEVVDCPLTVGTLDGHVPDAILIRTSGIIRAAHGVGMFPARVLITAYGTDPEQAKRLARTIAQVFGLDPAHRLPAQTHRGVPVHGAWVETGPSEAINEPGSGWSFSELTIDIFTTGRVV